MAAESRTSAPHPLRFLARLRGALALRGVPPERVDGTIAWVAAFIRFHRMRLPEELAAAEVGAFLTHLALDQHELLPRQARARQALLFLSRDFLHRDLGPSPVPWIRPPGAPTDVPVLPALLDEAQLQRRAEVHGRDLADGKGWIGVPHALERKYPRARWELRWQFVFRSRYLSHDPRSRNVGGFHVPPGGLARAVHVAVRAADLQKHATAHTFWHCFATHLLEPVG